MSSIRRIAAMLISICWIGSATSQSFPDRPIRIIAAYPAGTGVDVAARILANELSASLGQPVVVENRAGAGGNVAAEFVAKSERDGYTLLFTNNAHTINPSLYRNLTYDAQRDFIPISLAGSSAQLLVAHPDLPASTTAELIALARSQPGKINLASAGNGSPSHLAGALFKQMAGIDLIHVPYKGAPPALTDLMAGRVQLYMSGLPPVLPLVASGKVKAIAVTTAARSPAAPNVPSLAEAGLSGYDVTLWYGLLAPAGVPEPIVARLNQAVVKALATPEVKQKFVAQGVEPTSSSATEFRELIRTESEKWRSLIEASGIKPG
jgi:tripartite-type tricarboxylate transporter receptor subunit TctC